MRIRSESTSPATESAFIAKIADALGHPIRIEIVEYVAKKNIVRNDVCNGDLVAKLPLSQATVSQHVRKLVDAEILIVRKENPFSFYTANLPILEKFITALKEITKK